MKARLPAGMGGGPQNQKDLMRKAQRMQEQLAEKQAELEEREFTVTSGGGMVEVTMNGKKEIKSLNIKPEIVDPDDIEMLQDVIMAAVNEVVRQVEETTNQELGQITSGLSIPGLF
ncbi:MAG: YbaB/EbfC family nucleoid-associated protein [Oscillospiraceae bacterium]|nr:YbaB/EbfC family nucleoid-associated protein [Oscillospiraceae bacterium]MBP1556463.1 YbaB/EbfC family nucleoid-associated protein [Oscillospiraceae bacterium]MBP1578223.1 YbaB/EbfC family nucleoid-associated protein [Oscillospiraceae bacterium]